MYLLNILCFIFIRPIFLGFYTVDPLEAAIIMFMGKIVKVQHKPGLSWYLPIGRTIKKVSLGITIMYDIEY